MVVIIKNKLYLSWQSEDFIDSQIKEKNVIKCKNFNDFKKIIAKIKQNN